MRHSYRIFRSWIWEILSVILAIGLIAAISALLVSYDGEPAPDWGAHINFNALLALLSTILRAMLVVIVSQIICQQKWEWYGNKTAQPLSDLQQFDSGSRGSFGALLLIPTVIFKDTVTLIAALILVVSFLIGPFVQQASRTTPCTFTDSSQNATLPYAHYVPRRGGVAPFQGGIPGRPSPDAIVAILSSVTAPDGVENQIIGSCSTGNCTFRAEDLGKTHPKYVTDTDPTTHTTVGVCNKCVDIASLVSSNKTGQSTQYTLPNSFNVSYYPGGSDTAMIRPATNLTWMGDMLTPELRAISRWAYVNATFLAVDRNHTAAVAAACVLYPCLSTYTASITNNQLLEKQVSSEPMQIDVNNTNVRPASLNTGDNSYYHYTAVKSPCVVNGQTFSPGLNTSAAIKTTKVNLVNVTDNGTNPFKPTWHNISFPESCIYRHNAEFGIAISTVLTQEIFDGVCNSYKGPDCRKPRPLGSSNGPEMLSNLGVGTVLKKLIDGDVVYSNVTTWFGSFANAMTNRFRFEYGADTFNTTDRNLPIGEVRGLAWRTETCVSAHRDWLALPICLTAITSILMLWTIGANWRHRRARPVWKDSVFPLIFYRGRIAVKGSNAMPLHCDESDAVSTGTEEQDKLLETSEMNRISRETQVTFRWPDHGGMDNVGNGNASAFALKDGKNWMRQRKPRDTDADLLLETSEVRNYNASNIDHR
jgi:hypothetical protein